MSPTRFPRSRCSESRSSTSTPGITPPGAADADSLRTGCARATDVTVSAPVAGASGAGNTVLRTTDGGTTWERRPVPGADSLDFRSIRAIDDRTAFVASAGDGAAGQARIFRTTDGGATWTLVLADTTK